MFYKIAVFQNVNKTFLHIADCNPSLDKTICKYYFFIYLSKVQDTTDNQNDDSTETNSPKLRPKTVTKRRTDGYKKCLVNIGAVESNTPVSIQDKTLSPKPKSENCYICGKEFLLSSLKIHEKQCAKKHEKASKVNNTLKINKKPTTTSIKVAKKPQLEACYLCGKEFFVHSLSIHETQCIKNWKANKTPNASDKTVLERAMIEEQRNTLGEETSVQREDKSSTKGDTRNTSPKLEVKANGPERDNCEDASSNEKGQKSTKKEQAIGQNPSPKLEKKTDSPKQKKLKTIPCYLCGVAFLPHSLKIHEKKCRGKSQDLNHDNSNTVEKDYVTPDEENLTPEQAEGLKNKIVEQNFDETVRPNTPLPRKPKTIVCYICGQEFLKSSYAIHEKKCASAKESSQSTKAEESPLPKSKVSNPRSSAKPKTIVCYICGEEFLKSSYPFHEKKCANKLENLQENETVPPEVTKANQNQVKNSPKPRTIVCYICGQEFLKSSYAFHEKQCASKNKKVKDSETENEKSILRGNSSNKEKPSSDSQVERIQSPRRGPKTKACYICGKEVLVSSLKVHEQQCQKKTDILKNINQQKSPGQTKRAGRQSSATKQKTEAKPKTEVCYICGESFLSSSIKVHEIQCEKRWNDKS